MEHKSLHIASPGRICLFGDHQDYLGLPVIACAIDRYMHLEARPNADAVFRIDMPDLGRQRSIPLQETFEDLNAGDFFGSGLRFLRRKGLVPTKGYDLRIYSHIPINAGTSSSSALTVAWIHFLLAGIPNAPEPTAERLAEWAYQAEVIEHKAPGGKMDQYTIALGNTVFIDTKHTLRYDYLPCKLKGLVMAESGIPKSTIGVLGDLSGKAKASISHIKEKRPDFELETCGYEQVSDLEQLLSKEEQPYFRAAIVNHCITQDARALMNQEETDLVAVGKKMYQHHEVLRDLLGVSVAKIDSMIDAAMEAGALGAKIVGSGGGGSMVALAPGGKESEIIEAIKKQGARDAYQVAVGPGSRIIR